MLMLRNSIILFLFMKKIYTDKEKYKQKNNENFRKGSFVI